MKREGSFFSLFFFFFHNLPFQNCITCASREMGKMFLFSVFSPYLTLKSQLKLYYSIKPFLMLPLWVLSPLDLQHWDCLDNFLDSSISISVSIYMTLYIYVYMWYVCSFEFIFLIFCSLDNHISTICNSSYIVTSLKAETVFSQLDSS